MCAFSQYWQANWATCPRTVSQLVCWKPLLHHYTSCALGRWWWWQQKNKKGKQKKRKSWNICGRWIVASPKPFEMCWITASAMKHLCVIVIFWCTSLNRALNCTKMKLCSLLALPGRFSIISLKRQLIYNWTENATWCMRALKTARRLKSHSERSYAQTKTIPGARRGQNTDNFSAWQKKKKKCKCLSGKKVFFFSLN